MSHVSNPGSISPSAASASAAKAGDSSALDALTGGAFSAPTSGERAARVRQWLAGDPPVEQIQEVFKELSARDKGAARPLREKLDELRRAKAQEAIAADWEARANALLEAPRLNIADALAWQRDAAKAGAPLSREPLAGLKSRLADSIRAIEDLQHRAQVQREAAVLLAHRLEVLGTKSWRDAQNVREALQTDVANWQQQANGLTADDKWGSVDAKFGPALDSSRSQLLAVWEAFDAALTQTRLAAANPAEALPAVPVWADEIRSQRGEAAEGPVRTTPKLPVDPALRAQAQDTVRQALSRLEKEMAEGHGKASASAAGGLRSALKDNARLIDDQLESSAHAALAAAGELESWQRWRADQLRAELVGRAEALAAKPLGGRKQQETLRELRERWKQTDQGGMPNHAMWKRFDEACNQAYKTVEVWLEKVRADAEAHKAQRLALIEEVKSWSQSHQSATDWKAFNRELHAFSERWREAGHLSEKAFDQLQPLWKEAINKAHAPLEAVQKESIDRRQAMVVEAQALGAAPQLRIDAVKSLQQRWQAEAQTVPLERKLEQKLWDAFRKPIDDAFNRKTAERESAVSALSAHDRQVLEAAKALEQAIAGGDAQAIQAAMSRLEAVSRGESPAPASAAVVEPAVADAAPAMPEAAVQAPQTEEPSAGAPQAPAPKSPPKPARPVVAVRGDDRPGANKTVPGAASAVRAPRFGERKGAPGAPRFDDRGRRGDRPDVPRGPRLGDAAFRAQRDAVEHAQAALRKLAAQAHGEVLGQLLEAWEKRSADLLPGQQALGRAVTPAIRAAWAKALSSAAQGEGGSALLRLEMAAELPTPAEHMAERRALQLQLLTRRHDAAPVETWGADAAAVLASGFDASAARRLQAALKIMLRKA